MPNWQGFDASFGTNYATQTDDVQRRRLGSDIYDTRSNRWVYVQFQEIGIIGQTYRDAETVDIAGASPGAVTAVSAIGSRILNISGEFNDPDYIGAFGQVGGGDGHGQVFYITDPMPDSADIAEIALIGDNAGAPVNVPDDPGWVTALSLNSRVQMVAPGYGLIGGAPFEFIRGVLQRDVVLADLNKFGYVMAEGVGVARLDQSSGNTPVPAEPIIPVANGLVTGVGTLTVGQLASSIGESLFGNIAYSGDELIWVQLTIKRQVQSFRRVPGGENPLTAQRIY
jgi:hypothetical protein